MLIDDYVHKICSLQDLLFDYFQMGFVYTDNMCMNVSMSFVRNWWLDSVKPETLIWAMDKECSVNRALD